MTLVRAALDPFGAFVSRREPVDGGAGPLAGLRLCVKDNIEVEGQPFAAGLPLFEMRRGARTAPSVQRLLDAGAGFVGMTRTDDGGFGMTTPLVANPGFPGRTVGGSSGGAAAAVAAGLADLGLGTDTGGSVRIPAACTGIFGFKPTFGRPPTDGVWPLSPAFDHVGLLACELPLIERAARCLLDEDSEASAPNGAANTRLKIAVERSSSAFATHEMKERLSETIASLAKAGHEIVSLVLPDRRAVMVPFGTLAVAEAAQIYAGLSADKRNLLGAAARRALAETPSQADVTQARIEIAQIRRAYETCLRDCDVLLTSTLPIAPPPHGAHSVLIEGRKTSILELFIAATSFANLLGAPALAAPVGEQPFSLHLVAARGRDFELLRIAQRLLAAL